MRLSIDGVQTDLSIICYNMVSKQNNGTPSADLFTRASYEEVASQLRMYKINDIKAVINRYELGLANPHVVRFMTSTKARLHDLLLDRKTGNKWETAITAEHMSHWRLLRQVLSHLQRERIAIRDMVIGPSVSFDEQIQAVKDGSVPLQDLLLKLSTMKTAKVNEFQSTMVPVDLTGFSRVADKKRAILQAVLSYLGVAPTRSASAPRTKHVPKIETRATPSAMSAFSESSIDTAQTTTSREVLLQKKLKYPELFKLAKGLELNLSNNKSEKALVDRISKVLTPDLVDENVRRYVYSPLQ